jgi:hypothetical protein
VEAGAGHSADGFVIFHELFPDETGAGIFGHQNGDAQIDAEHVRALPIGEGIESVDEAIGAPDFLGVVFPHIA